jgi:O-antigen/teichoic acid export membrane protein
MSEATATTPAPAAAPPEAPSGSVLARLSALNFVARLVSAVAVFGLAVLTTNLLDTAGRGTYAVIATWVGIVSTLIDGGMPVLAADLVHRRYSESVLHGAVTAIAIVSCVLLVPISVGLSAVIGSVTTTGLVAAALIAVGAAYVNYEISIDQALGDVHAVSLIGIGVAAFPLVASALAAILFEPSVTVFVAAWAVGVLALGGVLFGRAIPHGGVEIVRGLRAAWSIARRSVSVTAMGGAHLLCTRIDILAVAAVLSAGAAGVYSIPVALASSLMLLSRSVRTAAYHSIMTCPDSEVASRLSGALRHGVIVVLVGGGLSIPVVAVASGWVFGDEYGDVWRPYTVLVVAAGFLCVVEMIAHFLMTRLEQRRELLMITLGMLVLNATLAVAGAAAFGLMGAAASTAIAYGFAAMAQLAYCARRLSVSMRELALPRRSDLALYVRAIMSVIPGLRSSDMAPR